MNMKRCLITALVCAFLASSLPAFAADPKPFKVNAHDSVKTLLQRNVGKRVELVLVSGQKLAGTVTMVGVGVVHISKITGQDFFDAVVRLDQVSALLIRVKKG